MKKKLIFLYFDSLKGFSKNLILFGIIKELGKMGYDIEGQFEKFKNSSTDTDICINEEYKPSHIEKFSYSNCHPELWNNTHDIFVFNAKDQCDVFLKYAKEIQGLWL